MALHEKCCPSTDQMWHICKILHFVVASIMMRHAGKVGATRGSHFGFVLITAGRLMPCVTRSDIFCGSNQCVCGQDACEGRLVCQPYLQLTCPWLTNSTADNFPAFRIPGYVSKLRTLCMPTLQSENSPIIMTQRGTERINLTGSLRAAACLN